MATDAGTRPWLQNGAKLAETFRTILKIFIAFHPMFLSKDDPTTTMVEFEARALDMVSCMFKRRVACAAQDQDLFVPPCLLPLLTHQIKRATLFEAKVVPH